MRDIPVSYIICSVPRCGSTLLARSLARMGIGAPDEFFNVAQAVDGEGVVDRADFTRCKSDADLHAYIESLRAQYTVAGIFGLKTHHCQLAQRPYLLENLAAIFPGARYIAMRRRDVLRQAISFVRAGQTGQWASSLPARGQPRFDRRAIEHALADISAQQSAWENFFRSRAIRPLRIVYEDFIHNYRQTLAEVCRYLGVKGQPMPQPPLGRQADSLTEDWVRRYRGSAVPFSQLQALERWDRPVHCPTAA